MNFYAKSIKEKLDTSINKLVQNVQEFVKQPGKDFTRNRSLTIKKLVDILITIGRGSQTKELLEYFEYSTQVPTSSAFIQQRNKLLPEALAFVLINFTSSLSNFKKFKGYRLLAVDGSVAGIPLNPDDEETYIVNKKDSRGFNQLHINALYDLPNKLYLDGIIQPVRRKNENQALVDMLERSNIDEKVILMADRGYESYNNIAHLEKKNWKYLIRVKAPNSGTGILSKTQLPINTEFDEVITVEMTRRQTKEIKANPKLYRFLSQTSTFDFLPLGSKDTYSITFRAVCVKIDDDNYQYFVTNLDSKLFSLEDLKEAYHLRWGVETSFRELKHALSMMYFHSKKTELIEQEIYAKIILYNFCETITLNVAISQGERKHTYQVNFTNAIFICIRFLRHCNDEQPPDVEALIAKYISPIRDNRKYPRRKKSQSFVGFLYRV